MEGEKLCDLEEQAGVKMVKSVTRESCRASAPAKG